MLPPCRIDLLCRRIQNFTAECSTAWATIYTDTNYPYIYIHTPLSPSSSHPAPPTAFCILQQKEAVCRQATETGSQQRRGLQEAEVFVILVFSFQKVFISSCCTERKNMRKREREFVCCLFYILATSKVISRWVPLCGSFNVIVLPPLGDQATSTMTWYPTQSHYPDTGQTSPCPILIMSSAWLESKKYQFLSHWFDSTKSESPNLPKWKTGGCSTQLAIPPGERDKLLKASSLASPEGYHAKGLSVVKDHILHRHAKLCMR